MKEIYSKNLRYIEKRFPEIAQYLEKSKSSDTYMSVIQSKTGCFVPILSDGSLMHSKYNPEHEAERLFDGTEEFVLFCGIGGGFHINYFLKKFIKKNCAALEYDYSSLKKLIEICDISELLKNERFILLPPINSNNFEKYFLSAYIPIIHGNLSIKSLRTWKNFFLNLSSNEKISNNKNSLNFTEKINTPAAESQDKCSNFNLSSKINNALETIKTDISTQARFGKIWMRNILINLKTASKFSPEFPRTDTSKTALILGAGPCLEEAITKIKENRDKFILFSSDTAFRILIENKIEIDFFISIDPQTVSIQHCFLPFSKNVIGIFDLCANPLCIDTFLKNGNKLFFVSSSHPLTEYAALHFPFPSINSSSGTVSAAALDIAKKIGFKKIETAGLDFAYTNGKAYARGSYLSNLYINQASKIKPEESLFTDLMFKSEVTALEKNNKITYKTKLLDGYNKFFSENINSTQTEIWDKSLFSKFNFNFFIKNLTNDVKKHKNNIIPIFLPFFAWRYKNTGKKVTKENLFFEIELVLQEILRYNEA